MDSVRRAGRTIGMLILIQLIAAVVLKVLQAINHEPTMLAVRAEREVQRLLAGDCSVPIGVRTDHIAGKLVMRGILFHADAAEPITATAEGEDPETVARALVAGLTHA